MDVPGLVTVKFSTELPPEPGMIWSNRIGVADCGSTRFPYDGPGVTSVYEIFKASIGERTIPVPVTRYCREPMRIAVNGSVTPVCPGAKVRVNEADELPASDAGTDEVSKRNALLKN